ncbi:hypothetical protein KAR91_22160 [Candidatus Pacearchaeota archaeon]|nr:hypothetical protein [Candidatus Pacearchaeota archaeon]
MSLCFQQECNICGLTPTVIYDAPTQIGPWAWMCRDCWIKHRRSAKLGVGLGQKFVNVDGGEKLEG